MVNPSAWPLFGVNAGTPRFPLRAVLLRRTMARAPDPDPVFAVCRLDCVLDDLDVGFGRGVFG